MDTGALLGWRRSSSGAPWFLLSLDCNADNTGWHRAGDTLKLLLQLRRGGVSMIDLLLFNLIRIESLVLRSCIAIARLSRSVLYKGHLPSP